MIIEKVGRIKQWRFIKIFLVSVLIVSLVVAAAYQPTPNYNSNSWISMSIALGASVLTVVSILTSVLTSAENDRRAEFRDTLNEILKRLEAKAPIYEQNDRSLIPLYANSRQTIAQLIEQRSPLRYSEGIIGFASFFMFLISVFLVIFGWSFSWIVGSFLFGVGFLIIYLFYCINEFLSMDRFSSIPKVKGSLELLSITLNGEKVAMNPDSTNKVFHIPLTRETKKIGFKVRFMGEVRNGFLHAVVRYQNGLESHIPDRNTYLIDFGFIDNYRLTLLERLDTGIIQKIESFELQFDVVVRSTPESVENPVIVKQIPISILGNRDVYRYCSVPDDYVIESIKLRIWEDPHYQPNYKRREVDLITILPVRV